MHVLHLLCVGFGIRRIYSSISMKAHVAQSYNIFPHQTWLTVGESLNDEMPKIKSIIWFLITRPQDVSFFLITTSRCIFKCSHSEPLIAKI